MTNRRKSERIFLTAKTRMVAEERASDLNSLLNALTAWYAFALIAVSIANLTGTLRHGIIEFSATLLSIALFGISLFQLGGRISQRAESFRKCYLALKGIYNSSDSEEEKMAAYERELEKYPNHKPIDYDLMIEGADSRGQTLWNDEGRIEFTETIKKRVKRHKTIMGALKTLGILLPPILFLSAFALSGVEPRGDQPTIVETPGASSE